MVYNQEHSDPRCNQFRKLVNEIILADRATTLDPFEDAIRNATVWQRLFDAVQNEIALPMPAIWCALDSAGLLNYYCDGRPMVSRVATDDMPVALYAMDY